MSPENSALATADPSRANSTRRFDSTEPHQIPANPIQASPIDVESVPNENPDPGRSGLTRRRALAVVGVSAGALTLAACSSSTPSASSPSSSSSSSSASSSGAAGGSGSGAVTTLDKITVGSAVSASDSNGKPIIIARPTATTAVAFTAICTHMGCTVAPNGGKLDCPCHGSVFNALTGAVENGPASAPLAAVDVTVKDGSVFLG